MNFGAPSTKSSNVNIDDNNNGNRLADDLQEGALKEDIVIKSNTILAFEPKSAPLLKAVPQVDDIELVCLPHLGVILSILLSLLLASVSLLIALSCWRASKRHLETSSRGKVNNNKPLAHPTTIPNPMLQ